MKPSLFLIVALIVCGSVLAQTLPPASSKTLGGGRSGSNAVFTSEVNVENYASFAAALAAIGSSTKTLVIGSTQKVSASVTVPATCTLRFTGAGLLTIAANQTLTVARRPIAEEVQIFNVSASGSLVTVTESSLPLPLRWWGMKADGSTDDAPAWQSAINGARRGTHFYLPSGRIIINKTIKYWGEVTNHITTESAPYGSQSDVLWGGSNGGTMIDVVNAQYLTFRGFRMDTSMSGSSVAAKCISVETALSDSSDDGAINAGTNAFTGTGLEGTNVGFPISISGAGPGGRKLNTTIAGWSSNGHVTLSSKASSTVSGAHFTSTSTYPEGDASGIRIEKMNFTNSYLNPNLIEVSIGYYSNNNCEHMIVADCAFNQNYHGGQSYLTDTTRGIAIVMGNNHTGGGGANSLDNTIRDCLFNNFTRGIYAFRTNIRNNLYEYVDTCVVGQDVEIDGDRAEFGVQFLIASGASNTIRNTEIAFMGTYNPSLATVESVGSGSLLLIGNRWDSDGSAIAVKNTNPGGSEFLVSQGNTYPNNNQKGGAATFKTFSSTSIGDSDSPAEDWIAGSNAGVTRLSGGKGANEGNNVTLLFGDSVSGDTGLRFNNSTLSMQAARDGVWGNIPVISTIKGHQMMVLGPRPDGTSSLPALRVSGAAVDFRVGDDSAYTGVNLSTVNGNTITAGTGTLTLGNATLNAGGGGTLGSNAFTSTAYQPAAGVLALGGFSSITGTLPAANVLTQNSIINSSTSGLQLSGDLKSPGNSMLYGTNGSGVKGWYPQPSGLSGLSGSIQGQGQSYVSTQFNKTDATLENVAGLSATLQAGRTYKFLATLDATLDSGGAKYAMGGSCSPTSINYRVRHLGVPSTVISSARQTTLGSAVNSTAGVTDDDVVIEGLITVKTAGTLTVQFAQQSANGTSTILAGSNMLVWDVP